MFKIAFAFTMFACTMACFTMPPKQTSLSQWRLTWPNLDDVDYVHDVHECPENYYSFLKTSHYTRESIGKITVRNVVGYNVCCPLPDHTQSCLNKT